jgi:hypothetical protein
MSINKLKEHFSDINEISELGIIAGGAVLCCYKTYLQINDLDVFVTCRENYIELLNYINQKYVIKNIKHFMSVVTLELFDKPPIQLIMSDGSSINMIWERFDMDYIRCAYDHGEFKTTPEFDNAIKTNHINVYKPNIKGYRAQKALDKGFTIDKILYDVIDIGGCRRSNVIFNDISFNDALQLPFAQFRSYEPADAELELNLNVQPCFDGRPEYQRIHLSYNAKDGITVKSTDKFELKFHVKKVIPLYGWEIEFVDNLILNMISEQWSAPKLVLKSNNQNIDNNKCFWIKDPGSEKKIEPKINMIYTAMFRFNYGLSSIWLNDEDYDKLTDDQKVNMRYNRERALSVTPSIWDIISEEDGELIKACRM